MSKNTIDPAGVEIRAFPARKTHVPAPEAPMRPTPATIGTWPSS